MSGELTFASRLGTVSVPPATLARIVVESAERVDGVRVRRPRRGVEVDVDDGHGAVALHVAVRYGLVLPALAEAVQEQVCDALERMCGIEVRCVDVAVEELVAR